jgi:hypothetical protein
MFAGLAYQRQRFFDPGQGFFAVLPLRFNLGKKYLEKWYIRLVSLFTEISQPAS